MFTNIKIALMDDAELASGDISVFGIELYLFVPSYAETTDTVEKGKIKKTYGTTDGQKWVKHCCVRDDFIKKCSPVGGDCITYYE